MSMRLLDWDCPGYAYGYAYGYGYGYATGTDCHLAANSEFPRINDFSGHKIFMKIVH